MPKTLTTGALHMNNENENERKVEVTMPSLLEVHQVTKTYRSGLWPLTTQHTYTAVNAISFTLKKGEILGLLGANGAGKTTIIQMLLGTLTPSSGSISYFGADFASQRIAVLRRIGYASGYDRLPAKLTISENLDIVGRVYGIKQPQRAQQIEKLLTFFGMWDLRNKQTGGLSAGEATRVMLAKAFIADPEIVLHDEPTASLDPDVAHEARQFILAERRERQTALLITSHNMSEVTELCDRVLVLKKGALIANSTPQLLAQSLSKVRVHLDFSEKHCTEAITYMRSHGLLYTLQGTHITIELDEHHIAPFLADIGKNNLMYSQISIDKPTLEDYFLHISQ